MHACSNSVANRLNENKTTIDKTIVLTIEIFMIIVV